MLYITIDEMQNNLSKYLCQVEKGESFVIMQGNKQIAELKPVSAVKQLRPFGLCPGEFTVPDDFDAPLPEDVISEFGGI